MRVAAAFMILLVNLVGCSTAGGLVSMLVHRAGLDTYGVAIGVALGALLLGVSILAGRTVARILS